MLDDLADYVTAQSTAFTLLAGSTGNLAKGELVDAAPAPDTLTAFIETAGVAGTYTFATSTRINRVWERPGLQVLSRSSSYPTARSNAETVYGLLDGVTGALPTSTGSYWYEVIAVQPPFDVGKDRNERHLVSTNYLVERRPA